jgi:pimeloyl-ACP methyl ester carboxylesterase
MMKHSFKCLFIKCLSIHSILLLLLASPLSAIAEGGYLRSSAPLDEPRGYCLDVAGFGVDARPDEPLRAHTCKYGEDNVDQLFKWVDFDSGHVIMPAYNRCLAVEAMQAGAQIMVEDCAQSTMQAWDFVPNGNLSLRVRPDLCLTLGPETMDAGAEILVFPGYRYRTSTLEFCREAGDQLQDFRWGRDDEFERGFANALRSGMPADIQIGIRDIFDSGEGNVLALTNALYEDVPSSYRSTEVQTSMDIAYGTHERQKLDIHVDTYRRGETLQPVVIYFHGGGYTRGAKENSHNVGGYYASIGLVGVSATYRLAPEAQWPDGANDVAATVQWVHENISQYGGDPDRIFLVGKSAGGGHVANYALRPEVLDQDYPEAAGVIIISGNYDSETEAYFGFNDLEQKQIYGNISRTSIPMMLTSSEFDLGETAAATMELAYELSHEHGALPRLRQLPGHNHYSPNISIGTSDRLLSDEILDFVLNTK